jgi:hypothetical protein
MRVTAMQFYMGLGMLLLAGCAAVYASDAGGASSSLSPASIEAVPGEALSGESSPSSESQELTVPPTTQESERFSESRLGAIAPSRLANLIGRGNFPSPSNRPQDSTTNPKSTITLYEVNAQCTGFASQVVELPTEESLDLAVKAILEEESNSDFAINGYRIQVDENGVATVDIRLPMDADRGVMSLAPCEQLAFFGSVKETLMQNALWNIQSVEFTERGQPILF